ncbi:MAG: bifunctional precorrin-2 dehydrogenase/sirohydrochlorin ferrochelatase [Planctomycetota bacterium]|nr:bifunctional precorrin-2 dehydrogenase/sirohydrochlorin ferrochelatase [Planctomycetota bacterium]
MSKYPIYLEVSSRRVVIIGGGSVATRKVQILLDAGARLVIVSPKIDDVLTNLCRGTNAELIKSRYSKNYLTGATLAIAATNDHTLNKQIYKDCQELEILCNVVDEPELCDFFVPAVVKRGDLQIAIGTEGNCPAYAGHIREKLEHLFTENHGLFLAQIQTLRKKIIEDTPDHEHRKALLGKLVDDQSFDYFVQNGLRKWRTFAEEIIKGYPPQPE